MKNKIYRILSLFLAITIVCSSLMMLTSCASGKKDLTAVSDENYVNFADGFTEEKVTDEASALKAVESVAAELGITDVEKELKVASVNTVGGDKYYRMQQYYEGYPVYGRTVVLAADSDGETSALTGNTVDITDVDVTPTITVVKANDAIVKYCRDVLKISDIPETVVKELKDDDLIIYNNNKNTKLAYLIYVGGYEFIVDARSAAILFVVDTVDEDEVVVCYNDTGSEKFDGYYYDDTKLYVAYNKQREIEIYNYLGMNSKVEGNNPELLESSDEYFGNVVNGDLKEQEKNYSSGVTYMNHISTIYDYFYTRFSEKAYGNLMACYNDGYDNGKNALGGRKYGKGYVSIGFEKLGEIDTIAHEYTHVVSRCRVNWIDIPAWSSSTDEPGAINEGYSDIFGELIEAEIKGKEPDWKHGSRIIYDPMSNNYPAAVGDRPFESFIDTKGVQRWGMPTSGTQYSDYSHGFSTIISHAAYLMWNGIDGTAEKKISEEQLAELWYRGLLLMQSDATFRQCANAIIVSAQQMFYNDPKNFTVEKLECVQEAFNKVGITANTTTSTWVENGATIHVIDVATDKEYDNYHIKFEKINLETRKIELVSEADVTDANGYVINLPADSYIVTVSDNDPEGSKNKFTKTIKVSENTSEDFSRNPQNPMILNKNVYIYTDFWAKTFVTDFTIPTDMLITLGELGVIEPEITPADADSYSIKWSSSNEEVATVSPNGEAGIITTLSKGTTVITAELTSGEKTITKTTNLRVASKARDTVLVLDISGSMYGEPLREMKKSAIQFCNDLLKDEYNNRVGLVFYDDEVTTVPLTADLNLLISEIEQIDDGGLTNMEAGLATADSMLKNNGRAEAIKNVVVMADGIPNEGKTSNSGSLPLGETYSRYTGSIIYANAVIDTAKRMQKSYNMYSLGFFHDLDGDAKDFAVALMKEVASKPEDYHQVDKAENLQFAFGDISEDISAGSKIVINIACPVDVKVTYGEEALSSAEADFCNTTSFGTLQLLGKNKDIKVITVDSDKDYNVEIVGTGDGKMDYSVNYFNEQEQLVDYRSFETVPITKTTVIKSNTNNDNAVDLNIDKDGDGKNDEVWTADVKSKGAVVEDKGPDNLNSVISGSSESSSSNSESSETDGNNVGIGIGLTVTALVVLILVIAGVVLVGVMIIVIIFAARSKKKKALPQNNMQNIPISSYQQKARTDNQSGAKTLISVQENITQAAPRMVGTIEFISGPMTGFAVPIKDGETLFIGKDPKFANIVIDSVYTKVSRKHCSISYDAKTERYYVVDTSLNGTYLKGVTQLAKGERALIDVNSILLLGNEECAILLK